MKEDLTTTTNATALRCRPWLLGGLVAESMADGKGCRDDKRTEERHVKIRFCAGWLGWKSKEQRFLGPLPLSSHFHPQGESTILTTL